MSFRATEFEFRNRFWIFGLVFWAAFSCYAIDPVNVAVAIGGGDDSRVRALFVLGAILNALAAMVRTWATAYLKSSVVHDRSLHSSHLVADGPFRYVRNPLYLGNLLMALGVGLMASRVGFAIVVAGIFLFNFRLIFREESELRESKGESYRRYMEAVPRLVPSLTPRVPSGGARPNWIDGFTAEIFFWGFALGEALFAVTLNLPDFWIVAGAGFLVYFLVLWRRNRGAA